MGLVDRRKKGLKQPCAMHAFGARKKALLLVPHSSTKLLDVKGLSKLGLVLVRCKAD
jgi:hypothetical protein